MRQRTLHTRTLAAALALLLVAAGWALARHGRKLWVPVWQRIHGRSTVAEVVKELEATAGPRMRAALEAAGCSVEGRRYWLLALKEERRLELWTEDAAGRRVRVTTWPVLAASGGPGPKLRQGDLQVPEGVYVIEGLNPNSAYHLSLRLDYPNAEDRARAAADGRTQLGGDIFIHGKSVSIGCLAIGDDAIEELFWLVATAGRERFQVIVAPVDLRSRPPPTLASGPRWVPALYESIGAAMAVFGGY